MGGAGSDGDPAADRQGRARVTDSVALETREPEVIIRLMLTFDQAADLFLGCAAFTDRAEDSYRRTYDRFSQRLPRGQDVSKVTTDDIRRYLGTRRHLAAGTIAGEESHLASLFRWLYFDGKIVKNPMDRISRTKRKRPEDLEVVTVDTTGVKLILAAGTTWTERLAPAMPAYLGPRRRAVASARLTDIDRTDPENWRMRFREKGDSIIWKPVPGELANLIRAAEADGAYERYDYVVPPEGYLQRTGPGVVRDDRVIWRVIKRVADRAGVECHVHALRAAFACFYDETFPGDVLALRDLMGHKSVKTTELYLRRRDKEAGMRRVRNLSWGVALEGDRVAARNPQFADGTFESSPVMGAGGFEPPYRDSQADSEGNSQHRLLEDLDGQIGVKGRVG